MLNAEFDHATSVCIIDSSIIYCIHLNDKCRKILISNQNIPTTYLLTIYIYSGC